MVVTVETVTDLGDDLLLVTGVVDGARVAATGWMSATTHHFPADQYDQAGNLLANAQPRQMTAAELDAYHTGLLAAAYDPLHTVVPPAESG